MIDPISTSDCAKFHYKFRRSFHKFPKDEELRQKWLQAMRRPDLEVTKYTNICHVHFHLDDIYLNTDRIQLHAKAVPARFHFPETGWIITWDKDNQCAISDEKFESLKGSTEPPDPALAGLPGMEHLLPEPDLPKKLQFSGPMPPLAGDEKSLNKKSSKKKIKSTESSGLSRASNRPARKRAKPQRFEDQVLDSDEMEEVSSEEEYLSLPKLEINADSEEEEGLFDESVSNVEGDEHGEEDEWDEDEITEPKRPRPKVGRKRKLDHFDDMSVEKDLSADEMKHDAGAKEQESQAIKPALMPSLWDWTSVFENEKYVIHKGVLLN